MTQNQKPYTFKTSNGRATLSMKKGDGRIHSATCEFPLYTETLNQETGKMEIKKQTKKQVEKYLYAVVLGA